MKKIFLQTFSTAINSYLALDPESAKRLHGLQDKVVTIELLPLHFIFQCHFSPHGIELMPSETTPAQVRIAGTPLAMISMLLNKSDRQQFFADDIKMEGDAELGLEVVELFDALEVDWEEPLAQLIGDVPTHYANRFVSKIRGWLGDIDKSITANVTEYLQEEAEWLPTREALKDFFNDIDNLRMDIDRIDAKIQQIRVLYSNDVTQEKVNS